MAKKHRASHIPGKRTKDATSVEQHAVSTSEQPAAVVTEDTESDADEQLLEAAAAWAARDEQRDVIQSTKSDQRPRPPRAATATPSRPAESCAAPHSAPPRHYSLHVTQLSYDATDFDVRHHFGKVGCAVTSVRLVYDRELRTKTFRGVAFVDVADLASFEIALSKLHGSHMLQRKINVRPVKTPQELAAIVKQTTDQVAVQIQTEKAKKKLESSKRGSKSNANIEQSRTKGKKEDGRKASKRKRDDAKSGDSKGNSDTKAPKKARATPEASRSTPQRAVASPRTKHGSKEPADKTKSSKPKLTKQQRNRRAAILRSRR